MLLIYSEEEFKKGTIEVLKKNNIDILNIDLNDALPKSFVQEFLIIYLLSRHPIEEAKIIFKTLWKKLDLIVKDYNGNIINVDEDMNINKFIFSLFVFEFSNHQYIINIDEWMLNNFYNAACRFCKIHSHNFYEEDPYKKENDDFNYLIREDKNELIFNDYIDFIPSDDDYNDYEDEDEYNDENEDEYNDDENEYYENKDNYEDEYENEEEYIDE